MPVTHGMLPCTVHSILSDTRTRGALLELQSVCNSLTSALAGQLCKPVVSLAIQLKLHSSIQL